MKRKLYLGKVCWATFPFSPRAFPGVNQGDGEPVGKGEDTAQFCSSFGIASFFQVDYDFSVEEMVQVKAATKNAERPFSVDIGYDYEVTSVEST